MKILMFLIVLVAFSLPTLARPADSCLKMVLPNDYHEESNELGSWSEGSYNPDSVLFDRCEYSPTYLNIFAKKYYSVALPPNYYPFEPMINYLEEKGVDDISNNYPEFKAQCQQIQQELGTMYFTRRPPFMCDASDGDILRSPYLIIYFENYQNVDSTIQLLNNTIESATDVIYYYRAMTPLSVEENKYDNSKPHVYPNPATDYIDIAVAGNRSINDVVNVYDVLGNVVLSTSAGTPSEGGHIRLDVSGLAAGVYFVRVGGKMYDFVKM